MTDHVHKLEAVGKETVAKLSNIQAAARASSNAQDAATLQDFTHRVRSIGTGELLPNYSIGELSIYAASFCIYLALMAVDVCQGQ